MSPDLQTVIPGAANGDHTGYEQWVRAEAEDGQDLSAACFIERPVDGLTEMIRAAGGERIKRFICGFLPDELDWPRPGVDGWLSLLVGRLEFVPWRLTPTGEATEIESGVFLHDSDAGGLCGTWNALATSLAAATGGTLRSVGITGMLPRDLAKVVESARWIFNDVVDWSTGFAIDEYATRLGRAVVRVRDPGYSPLRYAALGVALPPTIVADAAIPRLRPLLGNLTATIHRDPEADLAGNWFTPFAGALKWRPFFDLNSHRAFWADMDWPRLAPLPAVGTGQWLDRGFAWSALAVAAQGAHCPPEMFARAQATMTRWLVEQQRALQLERGREAALPRWIRLRPEWIDEYVKDWGGLGGTKALARWVERGLAWHQPKIPVFPVLQSSDRALSSAKRVGEHVELVRAWWRRWDQVPGLVAAQVVLEPAWQQACVEALQAALAAERPQDFGALDAERLWSASEIWESCFGARHATFRTAALWRCGRWSELRAALRAHVRPGLARGGGPFLRVVRAGFPTTGEFLDWVARQPPAETVAWDKIVVTAALNWHRRCGRRLWCRQPDPADVRILAAVLRCLPALGTGIPAGVPVNIWLPLCALGGRGDSIAGYVATLPLRDRQTAECMCVVAAACWMRGREAEARSWLQAWPQQPDDSSRLLFLRAVACQLVGDLDAAAAALDALRARAPRYFEENVPDAFWEWLAVVFLQAGRADDATAFHARADAMSGGTLRNSVGMPAGTQMLAAGWTEVAAVARAVPEIS